MQLNCPSLVHGSAFPRRAADAEWDYRDRPWPARRRYVGEVMSAP
jgi:hypothetical protein